MERSWSVLGPPGASGAVLRIRLYALLLVAISTSFLLVLSNTLGNLLGCNALRTPVVIVLYVADFLHLSPHVLWIASWESGAAVAGSRLAGGPGKANYRERQQQLL